jgi:transposase-like protein
MVAGLNRYYKRSRISEPKFRVLVRCFSEDLTATQTARLAGLSVRSVNAIFLRIRRRLAAECEAQSPFSGVIEVDESYFGPQRVRGKKGRGAGGKTVVFGVFQRGENVYTQIVPNCKKATLQRVIRGRVSLESVIHSDGWSGYDGLVDMGYQKHFRVKHGEDQFADRTNHINGIEAFWSSAKRRLAKFNGVHHHTFYLHLKECEFRFNHRDRDLYKVLLRLLRDHPL